MNHYALYSCETLTAGKRGKGIAETSVEREYRDNCGE